MSELDTGTQFDFTYAPGTSIEQILGFEMAGQIWSSYLDDDVTVRIYVESTDELPEDVVGAALPGKKKKLDLNNLRKKLTEDASSSDDFSALLNVPSDGNEFSIFVDGRELNQTKDFKFTNANAKALDILDDDAKKLDGYILVNDLTGQTATGWDYDALRSGSGEGIDFLSVAMHEIGHVLGFVSGIDDDGWLEVLTKAEREEKELKDDAFKFATPLDLFRYSDNDMAVGKIDLSTGGNPFFSIDGGGTNLASFSSGEYTDRGGDGYQASHWKNGSGVGVMNPILKAGERKDISDLDLKAMDVIGWDIDTSSLDWGQMYDNALQEAETANVLQDPKDIEDMEKSVEKMVKESEYDGRRSRRGSGSSGSWQYGFWQYTTIEEVATEEIPEIVDSAEDTDSEENSEIVDSVEYSETAEETETVDSTEEIELEEDTESAENFETDDWVEDTNSEENSEADDWVEDTSLEDSETEDIESESGFILQPSDTSGLELVSGDEHHDPLLSGGLLKEG